MSRRKSKGQGSRLGTRRVAPVAIAVGRLRHPRAALLAATALQVGALTVVLLARPARAQSVAPTLLPSGGQVIGGTAAIARSGNTLTIDQSTTNAAINWQNFSIGSQAAVGFHVPTPQSTTINRVVGPDPSVIAGRLTSNGRVVIANQSGIVFANGAQVDVNALVASAPGITAANARAGKLIFDQPAHPGAAVVNNGRITIRQAGLAALVGPSVANNGVISARLGRVILQGAAAATLDFYGDGLLSFDVTKQVTRTAKGATALVTNTGTIVAEGGTVTLSAAAVDGLVTSLVEAGGTIATPSVGAQAGSIVIDGTGGSVTVVGQLTAQGQAPGTTGGTIAVSAGNAVTVAPGARLDASGDAGGGTVAVGTTAARAQGGPTVKAPAATSVTVAQNATLTADAWTKGDGGHVTVMSLNDTDFAGYAEARGGAAGGNGGKLEISGGQLQLTGGIDASAPKGAVGSLLLDPGNLKIVSGGGDTVTNGTTYTGGSTTSLDPGSIEAISADVTLSADGHISIESALNVTHGLSLFAGGSIVVDQPVSSTAGIELASGQVTLSGSNAGGITINAAITSSGVSAGADGIVLSAGTNGIALNSNLNAKIVDLSTAGNGATQTASSVITASTFLSSTGVTGDVWLIGTSNAIDSVGSVAVTGGRFDLRDTHVLTLDGSISFPGTASAGIAVGGMVEGAGGTINGGTGLVSIAAFPSSDALGVGASGVGTISLDPAALAAITAGTLELSGVGINLGATASLATIPTIDLEAGLGTITMAGGTFTAATLIADGAGITQTSGVLAATLLTAGTAFTGGVTLDAATNQIGTIAALGSLSGDLRVVDGTALTLNGSNQATNVVLSDSATGTAITLDGTLNATSLDLSAANGSVVGQSTGTITAATLASASGITGSLDLSASSNTIGALGALTATGGLKLVDTTLVSIGGAVAVGSGNTLSIADDGLAMAVGGSLAAPSGVVELGPISSGGTVLLGAVGTAGTIAPGSLAAITAGTLRLGQSTLEANEVGTILSGGTVSAANIGTLKLDATGGVTLSNPVTLGTTGALAGAMASLAATNIANAIPNLGTINAGTGNVTVKDASALSVAGAVTGGVVVLSDSATGTAISVAGALAGQTSVELDASAGAVSGAGTITTPLLTSATLAQGITLSGSANSIATLGTLQAAAGNVLITDGAALDLESGVSVGAAAGNVVLTDGTTGTAITIGGGAVSASGTLGLVAGAGSISLAGGTLTATAGTLDLSAASGSVTQTGGTITAATLVSSAGVGGPLHLTGGHNTITTLGSVSAGALTLADTSSLTVGGAVQGSPISLTAPGISLSATGSLLSTGTVMLNPQGDGVSEGSGGMISAATLKLPSNTGAVTLTGANTIATLGAVAASGAAVDISVSSGTLNVAGPVVATNATLADTASGQALSVSGSIAVTGTLDLASAGAITETGTITAPTLVGSASGMVELTGSNTIGVLGSLTATGGLQLVDTTLVSVSGVVSVGSGNTLSIADDGLGIAVGGSLAAPSGVVELGPVASGGTVLIAAAGTAGTIAPGSLTAITAGTLRLGKTVLESNEAGTILSGGTITATNIGTLELDASGGVTLADPVTLASAGVLAGTMASLGVTSLTNSIPDLGNISAGTGLITVSDATPLAVQGSVAGGSVTLSAPSIAVPGSVSGTTLVNLDAGAFGMSLTGTLSSPSGTVDLSSGGAVSQSSGVIAAGTLASSFGFGGMVDLASTSNAIGVLGAVAAAGQSLTLEDGSALMVTGPVTAGVLSLSDSAPGNAITLGGTLTIAALELAAPSGSVVSGSGASVNVGALTGASPIAGSLDLSGGGVAIGALGSVTATGGLKLIDQTLVSIEGVVSVGSGNTLSIADDSLAMVAGGSLSAPGGVVELGPVASGGTVLLGTAGVAGEIAPGDLAAITAETLRLGKTALDGNEVATILSGGVVTATNIGTLELDASGGVTLANPVTLSGTGVLSGTMANLSATASGNLIPNLGSLNAGTGTIDVDDATSLSVPGSLSAGTITLFAQTLAVSGSIGATTQLDLLASPGGIGLTGTLSSPTGTVDLTTTGSIAQTGGVIIAGTLISAFGAGGPVSLTSPQNTIGTLGAFSATGQNVLITDSTSLLVAGAVAGSTVTLDAPTLSVTGTVAGTTLVRLEAGAGGIALAGTVSASTGVLDLEAASGTVSQTAGAITAGTLTSFSSVGGTLDLTGGSNTIAALGALTAGSLALTDTQLLTVAGVVQASPISLQAHGISLSATGSLLSPGTVVLNPVGDGVTEGAGGLISAATLNLPSNTGAVTLTGANTIATLGSVMATGAAVDISVSSGTLNVAGPVVASNATLADTASGQSLSISGLVNVAGTLDLASAGGITESGTIAAPTVIGTSAGSVALTGSNTITDLGSFAVSPGNFALTDQTSLAVAGPLTASGITLDVAALGGLTLAGSVDAGSAGTLDVSSLGPVDQSVGFIRAGVVRSALGVGSLNIAVAGDDIASVGSLGSGGAVDLASAISLDAMGPVSGSAVTLSAPTLSVSGSVSGTSLVSLDAGAGGLGLSGTVTSPTTVEIASLGSVTQVGGAIVAGTLSGVGALGGAVELGASGNAIGVLGALSAPGQGVVLTDGTALVVSGPVSAASVSLTDTAGGTALTVAGGVTAGGTLGLAAPNGTVSLGGTLNAGVLDASGLTVTKTGGTVVAGTLENTGSLGVLTLVAGSNTIGALGPVVATGAVSLSDAGLVTVGSVSAPTVAISDAAGIVVAGPLVGTDGVTLASSAGSVGLTGTLTVGTGTLDVTAAGGFGESVGAVLSTPTLASTGGIGGTGVQLTGGGNTIATLGPITVAGGITLTDQAALTQTGLLSATSGNVVLSDAAASGPALTLDGTIMAAGITLSSTNAGITGNAIDQPATGVLAGQGGAGTSLTVNVAGGSVVIQGTANQIASLAGQAAGAIILDDAHELSVTPSLVASGITLDVTNAGGLILAGSVDVGAGGTLDVSAPVVSQISGFVRAGVVRSALGVGSLSVAVAGDDIASVGSIAATSLVDVASSTSLNVTGPVSASSVTLSAPTLSVSGSVSGTSQVKLGAGSGPLMLSGTVSSPGGVVDLSATGAVEQSGGAIDALQLVSSLGLGGPVDLGSTQNVIGILGSLAAPGQNVTITDGVALTVQGPVSGANLALRDLGSGVALAVNGSVNATRTLGLAAPNGTVSLGGTLNAGVLDASGLTVTETGGTVVAGTLENTGSLGVLTLVAGSNTIGALGPVVATGAVSLSDAGLVTVGSVSAPTVAISDAAGIVVAGPLVGTDGVTLASSAGSVGLSGTLSVGSGSLDVTAAGGFGENGGSVLHVPVLVSAGGIGGTGVRLSSGRNTITTLGGLVASGGITLADQVGLTQTGLLEATSGNVVLSDAVASGPALTLNGTIMASGIVLGSTAAGIAGNAIEQPGGGVMSGLGGTGTNLTLNAASGSVVIQGTGNRIAAVAGQALSGAITLNDAAPLTITNSLVASGTIGITGTEITVAAPLTSAEAIRLTAGTGFSGPDIPAITIGSTVTAPILSLASRNPGLTNSVVETGSGAISTGTLTAIAATGTINLDQRGNSIGTLGAVTAPGQTLVLGISAPMTISGPVSVGNFALDTTQPVFIDGNLAVADTWSIASSSNIDRTAGVLQVGTITGRAGAVADFGSGAYVGTLGPFAMTDSTLALANAQPLVIDGPIVADYIAISAVGTVTLRGDIETVGLPLNQQLGSLPSDPGSYISATGLDAAIIQLGQTTVTTTGNGGGNPTLRFQLPLDGGGLISFANLAGPQLNLILGLQGGGTAQGTIAVGSLTVIGGTGAASLNGTVGSFAGSIAAQNSDILPRPNGRYTLNNCPLKSVSCIVLPIALVIPANPLDELLVSIAPPQNDDLDILLPGIARKDY